MPAIPLPTRSLTCLLMATAFGMALILLGWPLLGFKRITDAVEARDVAQLSQLLNVQEIKRSLAVQIARAQLKLITPDRHLSPLAHALAMQAAVAAADSHVAEIVEAGPLLELLYQAHTDALMDRSDSIGLSWAVQSLRSAGKLLASELRGRNFYVSVPLSADVSHRYRLHLRLSNWNWKLAGVELPEELQVKLARELLRRTLPQPGEKLPLRR